MGVSTEPWWRERLGGAKNLDLLVEALPESSSMYAMSAGNRPARSFRPGILCELWTLRRSSKSSRVDLKARTTRSCNVNIYQHTRIVGAIFYSDLLTCPTAVFFFLFTFYIIQFQFLISID